MSQYTYYLSDSEALMDDFEWELQIIGINSSSLKSYLSPVLEPLASDSVWECRSCAKFHVSVSQGGVRLNLYKNRQSNGSVNRNNGDQT